MWAYGLSPWALLCGFRRLLTENLIGSTAASTQTSVIWSEGVTDRGLFVMPWCQSFLTVFNNLRRINSSKVWQNLAVGPTGPELSFIKNIYYWSNLCRGF